MTIAFQNRQLATMARPVPSDITPNLIPLSDLGVPQGHVLVLGLLPLREGVLEGVRTGNLKLMMQGVPLEEFLRTIRVLAIEGPTPTLGSDPPLRELLLAPSEELHQGDTLRIAALTNRERQVMGLIGAGSSNQEIATELNIAVHTVKTHVHKVLGKLAVRTRLEVAALVHAADRAQTQRRLSRVA